MSKGSLYDNAVIESFFITMEAAFLYLKDFESIKHFKQEFEKFKRFGLVAVILCMSKKRSLENIIPL
ncbi:hypothetical protein BLD50_00415 [Bacillus cereus]|nr:hypothetical protein BLD50_00415 [Bacillus cereus]